jgi:hypothetical protein
VASKSTQRCSSETLSSSYLIYGYERIIFAPHGLKFVLTERAYKMAGGKKMWNRKKPPKINPRKK